MAGSDRQGVRLIPHMVAEWFVSFVLGAQQRWDESSCATRAQKGIKGTAMTTPKPTTPPPERRHRARQGAVQAVNEERASQNKGDRTARKLLRRAKPEAAPKRSQRRKDESRPREEARRHRPESTLAFDQA
jgi:hypothetical protein